MSGIRKAASVDAHSACSRTHNNAGPGCNAEPSIAVSLADRSDLDTASVGCQFLARQERREDIPLLTRYFVQKLAQRMSRDIETIPTSALDALTRYDWPGNIRELQNVLERSVILTNGSTLHVAMPSLWRRLLQVRRVVEIRRRPRPRCASGS